MAYTDIDKPSDYFNTKLYTGDGTDGRGITGVGFQPDWCWFKARSTAYENQVYDVVRGATKRLVTNDNTAEGTQTNGLQSFDSDGFTVGNANGTNVNAVTYASWNWLASNSTASNTDGSITSTVSANTTSGFSIVKYTGSGANATVGHGIGVAPKMVIIKRLENATHWLVGGGNIGWTKNLYLSTTSAEQTANHFQDQSPSSSVVYMTNDGALNNSSEDYIMYCFAEKKGFSKFGSYTGNGNADGTFIYTGFKPAWFLFKKTDSLGSWIIKDNKRLGYNGIVPHLQANTSDTENTDGWSEVDFLSNGIKLRNADSAMNGSGVSFIYMAFAENPFVTSTGIPTTAR